MVLSALPNPEGNIRMTRNVPRAAYSAGQDALENFQTLSTYAASGAKKAKRRVHENGLKITIIKNGHVVEIMPDGNEQTVRDVAAVARFKPLMVSK